MSRDKNKDRRNSQVDEARRIARFERLNTSLQWEKVKERLQRASQFYPLSAIQKYFFINKFGDSAWRFFNEDKK